MLRRRGVYTTRDSLTRYHAWKSKKRRTKWNGRLEMELTGRSNISKGSGVRRAINFDVENESGSKGRRGSESEDSLAGPSCEAPCGHQSILTQNTVKIRRKLKSKYSLVGRHASVGTPCLYDRGETCHRAEKACESKSFFSLGSHSLDRSLLSFLKANSVEEIKLFIVSERSKSQSEVSQWRNDSARTGNGRVWPKRRDLQASDANTEDFIHFSFVDSPAKSSYSPRVLSQESFSSFVNSISSFKSRTLTNKSKDALCDSFPVRNSPVSQGVNSNQFVAYYVDEFLSTPDVSSFFGTKRKWYKAMFHRAMGKLKLSKRESDISEYESDAESESVKSRRKSDRLKKIVLGIRDARIWEWLRDIPRMVSQKSSCSLTTTDPTWTETIVTSSGSALSTTASGTSSTVSEWRISSSKRIKRAFHWFSKKKASKISKICEPKKDEWQIRAKFARIVSNLWKKVRIRKKPPELPRIRDVNDGEIVKRFSASNSNVMKKNLSEDLTRTLGEFPKSVNLKIFANKSRAKSTVPVYQTIPGTDPHYCEQAFSHMNSESKLIACPVESYKRLSRKPQSMASYEKTWKVHDRVISERPTTDPGVKKPSIGKKSRDRQRLVDDKNLRTEELVNKLIEESKKKEMDEWLEMKKKKKKKEPEEDELSLDSETRREISSSGDEEIEQKPLLDNLFPSQKLPSPVRENIGEPSASAGPTEKIGEPSASAERTDQIRERKASAGDGEQHAGSSGILNCPCQSSEHGVFKLFIHDNYGCEVEIVRSPEVSNALKSRGKEENDIVANSLLLPEGRIRKKRHKKRNKKDVTVWCNPMHIRSFRQHANTPGRSNEDAKAKSSSSAVPFSFSYYRRNHFQDKSNQSTEKLREKYLSGIYTPSSASSSCRPRLGAKRHSTPLWQCLKRPSHVWSSQPSSSESRKTRRRDCMPPSYTALGPQTRVSFAKTETADRALEKSGTEEPPPSTEITMDDLIAMLSSIN